MDSTASINSELQAWPKAPDIAKIPQIVLRPHLAACKLIDDVNSRQSVAAAGHCAGGLQGGAHKPQQQRKLRLVHMEGRPCLWNHLRNRARMWARQIASKVPVFRTSLAGSTMHRK